MEDLKKKKRRRKEGGEFSFWETNLGLEGLSYKMGERRNEKGGFFEKKHVLEFLEEGSTYCLEEKHKGKDWQHASSSHWKPSNSSQRLVLPGYGDHGGIEYFMKVGNFIKTL